MVKNLRLGGSSSITLTPADSEITANLTLSASSNSFGNTNEATGVNIIRMHDNGSTWVTPTIQGANSTVNTTGIPPSQTQYIGNYYNWYTATAGSGTYSTDTNVIAVQSICPKGWRLPTGGAVNAATGNGESQQLYDVYSNYNNFISATSAVLSGHWTATAAGDQGSNGVWWSSTAHSAVFAYGLYLSPSGIGPLSSSGKGNGRSVRCIAR